MITCAIHPFIAGNTLTNIHCSVTLQWYDYYVCISHIPNRKSQCLFYVWTNWGTVIFWKLVFILVKKKCVYQHIMKNN